jgi:hypothetical protein
MIIRPLHRESIMLVEIKGNTVCARDSRKLVLASFRFRFICLLRCLSLVTYGFMLFVLSLVRIVVFDA